MSKVRKKYNKMKLATNMANAFVKYMGVSYLPNNNCELIDFDKHQVLKNSRPTQVTYMTQFQYNWNVLLMVYGRDELGNDYMKTEEVAAARKCYSGDIHEAINEAHDRLYQNFNKNHFVSLGWLASPKNRIWDYEKVTDLMSKLGAWDYQNKVEFEIKEINNAVIN